MSYSPNNTPVYLRACAGCFAGLTSSANTDITAADYTLYGQMADAWAQEVDTVWGAATPTNFELLEIEDCSSTMWAGRSSLGAAAGILAGSYNQTALALMARVKQANAQVVAEGVDPSDIGGAAGGAALASAWGDNSGLVAFNDTNIDIIKSVSITPASTGKLRVTITCVNQGVDGGACPFTLGVNHGASPGQAFDYAQAQIFTSTLNGAETSVVVRLDKLASPIVFPVGTPVQINAVGQATEGGQTQIPAHGCQIDIQEVSA